MRIIPVIDLKERQVVRGIAGRRDQYRPIQSSLTTSPAAGDVAAALKEHFGFDEIYVADLDAIAGQQPNWQALQAIAESLPTLWLDAGTGDVTSATNIAQGKTPIDRVVVGLESIAAPADLPSLLQAITPQRAVFSLDLKEGQPLTQGTAWDGLTPQQIAQLAAEAGFERFIVLDLARVGTGQGPGIEPLCEQLRRTINPTELVAGGGVRHLEDLHRLSDAGCNAALVASALHDGRISRADLAKLADR